MIRRESPRTEGDSMVAPGTVDEYMASLPEDRRAVLEELRQTIRAAAPEATETIAYGMPAFTSRGRLLVSFAAYKLHYSLFPASGAVKEALGEELRPYLAGRGTVRFRADAPIPAGLVTKIVTVRVGEAAARVGQ
jgi:uncharacterized protein YdhG (YjbR/CyaY superfamily)